MKKFNLFGYTLKISIDKHIEDMLPAMCKYCTTPVVSKKSVTMIKPTDNNIKALSYVAKRKEMIQLTENSQRLHIDNDQFKDKL